MHMTMALSASGRPWSSVRDKYNTAPYAHFEVSNERLCLDLILGLQSRQILNNKKATRMTEGKS